MLVLGLVAGEPDLEAAGRPTVATLPSVVDCAPTYQPVDWFVGSHIPFPRLATTAATGGISAARTDIATATHQLRDLELICARDQAVAARDDHGDARRVESAQ